MATHGVKGILLGILDPVTKKLIVGENGLNATDGIFDSRGTTAKGVTSANISNRAPSREPIWGNNDIQDYSTGKATPSVAAAWNDLPHDILHKLLGDKYDGKGTYIDNASGVYPHVAMIIVSSDLLGNDIYFSFYDGFFSPADINNATDNTAQQRAIDNLTFSPIANENGENMETSYSQEEGFTFDDLKAKIFPTDKAPETQAAKLNKTKKAA